MLGRYHCTLNGTTLKEGDTSHGNVTEDPRAAVTGAEGTDTLKSAGAGQEEGR